MKLLEETNEMLASDDSFTRTGLIIGIIPRRMLISKGFVVEQFPFYVNDFICLNLRVIVEGNPLFVLIPGLDGTRMCLIFATFLLQVRNKVCNADTWVFVEVR